MLEAALRLARHHEQIAVVEIDRDHARALGFRTQIERPRCAERERRDRGPTHPLDVAIVVPGDAVATVAIAVEEHERERRAHERDELVADAGEFGRERPLAVVAEPRLLARNVDEPVVHLATLPRPDGRRPNRGEQRIGTLANEPPSIEPNVAVPRDEHRTRRLGRERREERLFGASAEALRARHATVFRRTDSNTCSIAIGNRRSVRLSIRNADPTRAYQPTGVARSGDQTSGASAPSVSR